MREAFDQIDVDHSGQISVKELEGLMKNLGYNNVPSSLVSQYLSSYDIDNDG